MSIWTSMWTTGLVWVCGHFAFCRGLRSRSIRAMATVSNTMYFVATVARQGRIRIRPTRV